MSAAAMPTTQNAAAASEMAMAIAIEQIRAAKAAALSAIHRSNAAFGTDSEILDLALRLRSIVTDLQGAESQAVRIKSRIDLAGGAA